MTDKLKIGPLVLNVKFGGFGLDKEMADWLIANRGWRLVNDDCAEPKTLIHTYDRYDPAWLGRNDIEFRSNPDLVDCVRELQKIKGTYSEDRLRCVHNLKIQTVDVEISVNDYHDGKEEIVVSHSHETEK